MLLAEHPWPSYERKGRIHGPDDYLLWRYPLARAFALYVAATARYGCESSAPTYVEMAMVRAKRACEAEWERTEMTKPE